MKILAIVASLLAMESTGFAVDIKVNVEGRVDYLNQSNVTKAQDGSVTATKNQADFRVDRLRINAVGKATEQLSYRVRLNVTNTPATVSGTSTTVNRDNTPNMLELLYVDDKLSDSFTLRAGKQLFAEALGWEPLYPATDIFTFSTAFNTYNASYGNYRVGVGGIYAIAGQRITLGAFTPTKSSTLPDSTGPSQVNYAMGYGLYYTGSFWDAKFIPVAGYSVFGNDGDVDAAASAQTSTGNDTLLSYGFRILPVEGLHVELVNNTLTQPWRFTNSSGSDSVTNSLVANVGYRIDKLMPFVNYINDKFTGSSTSKNFVRSVYDIGVWYYPYQDINFRYHLVYTSDVTTNDAGSPISTITANKIWLGMKFDI